MEENLKNAENSVKEVRGIPFKKGDDPRRNIEGRPKGAENFSTKWRAFIEKVAKQNNLTPNEIDEQLLAVGFKKAKEGDYNFYRDVHDRVYGRPTQPIDHTTLGEKIEMNPELVAIAKEYEEKLKAKL